MNGSAARTAVAAAEAIRSSFCPNQRRHAVTHDRDTELIACPADTIFELIDRTRPRVVDADNHVARLEAGPVSGRISLGTQDLRAQQVTVEAIAGQNLAEDSAGEAAFVWPECDRQRLDHDV